MLSNEGPGKCHVPQGRREREGPCGEDWPGSPEEGCRGDMLVGELSNQMLPLLEELCPPETPPP